MEIIVRPEDVLDRPAKTRQDQNPALIYLGSLALGSRRTMHGALDSVAAMISKGKLNATTFPWWEVRYQHMERVQSVLCERLAPATVNKTMTAVKQVLLRCRRLGLMTSDLFAQTTDFKRVKAWRKVSGRMIERDEIMRMLASCDTHAPIDARDKALLMLLATGGVRRNEAASIQLHEFDRARQTVLISKAKGGKQRKIAANIDMMSALSAWIVVRGDDPGPLFCPVYKGGHVRPSKQMSPQSVYAVVDKVAMRTKLTEDISPHDFRRTFISMLLDAGVDLKTVSNTVGHESTDTTGRYDRRGERAIKAAVDKLPSFKTDVSKEKK